MSSLLIMTVLAETKRIVKNIKLISMRVIFEQCLLSCNVTSGYPRQIRADCLSSLSVLSCHLILLTVFCHLNLTFLYILFCPFKLSFLITTHVTDAFCTNIHSSSSWGGHNTALSLAKVET